MQKASIRKYEIRPVNPDEFENLGALTVDAYKALQGMPSKDDQPEYYAMLYDVEGRVSQPTIEILVAVTLDHELLGGVTFIGDMKYYHSGGTATANTDASGIRLLAVKPEARGLGVGKALMDTCIQRAMQIGRSQVILHTTKAMQIAWRMYEKMGFLRSPDLDFNQSELSVYGFRLRLPANSKKTTSGMSQK